MATKQMDAIALLKADHRAVEALFEEYENARGSARMAKIVEQICTELIVHTMIEEEIFYPAVEGKIEEDLIDEAYVEHDGAKMLIAELMDGTPGDDYYDAKVSVLSEEIKHHVQEEEARSEGMFAQARDAGIDVKTLGEEMAARKEELLAQIKSDGLPRPQLRTMTGAGAMGMEALPAE